MRPNTVYNDGFQIAVLDRGFVYIGDVCHIPGEGIIITNAWNLRRWGTTAGLGQLALHGPTPQTEMDPVGTVTVMQHAVLHFVSTARDCWKKI